MCLWQESTNTGRWYLDINIYITFLFLLLPISADQSAIHSLLPFSFLLPFFFFSGLWVCHTAHLISVLASDALDAFVSEQLSSFYPSPRRCLCIIATFSMAWLCSNLHLLITATKRCLNGWLSLIVRFICDYIRWLCNLWNCCDNDYVTVEIFICTLYFLIRCWMGWNFEHKSAWEK